MGDAAAFLDGLASTAATPDDKENYTRRVVRFVAAQETLVQQAQGSDNNASAQSIQTAVAVAFDKNKVDMGGERDMVRLEPRVKYPALVQKPVAKWFQKLYLDRIEGIYKKGAYEKYNLQACVTVLPCTTAHGLVRYLFLY